MGQLKSMIKNAICGPGGNAKGSSPIPSDDEDYDVSGPLYTEPRVQDNPPEDIQLSRILIENCDHNHLPKHYKYQQSQDYQANTHSNHNLHYLSSSLSHKVR